MDYKIRDGIIMERVCGVPLLIATLEATRYCPYAMQLNEASAYIWEMLFQEKTVAEMTESVATDFNLSKEEAHNVLLDFLAELKEQNYLLSVNGGKKDEV